VQLQLSLDFHKIQVSFLFFPLLAAQGMAPADGTCRGGKRMIVVCRKEGKDVLVLTTLD